MGPACDNMFIFCLGSLISEHSAFSHFVLKNLFCASLVRQAIASESLVLRELSLLFFPT